MLITLRKTIGLNTLIYNGLFISLIIFFSAFSSKKNEGKIKKIVSCNISMDDDIRSNPLTISLLNLGNYLIQQNNKSENFLFKSLNNFTHTPEELQNMGYIDITIILKELKIIKKETNLKSKQEVWDVINYIGNNSNFEITNTGLSIKTKVNDRNDISENNDKDASLFCLFCCRGCLDGVPKNHCITVLFWTWGPDC